MKKTMAAAVRPVVRSPLRWTEWLELVWRGLLLGGLIWFGFLLRDIMTLHTRDRAEIVQARLEAQMHTAEMIRLLRAICLSTTTVYEASRGVCDPSSTAEIHAPPPPTLRGGLYRGPR